RDYHMPRGVLHILADRRGEGIAGLGVPGRDRVARRERYARAGGGRERGRDWRLGRRVGRPLLGRGPLGGGFGRLGRPSRDVLQGGRGLGRGERRGAGAGVARLALWL